MRIFRHAVGQMGWLIGIQPAIFFFVVGLSTFVAKADKSDAAPSDNPPSHCVADDLRDKLESSLRYLLMTVVFSVLFTLAVRAVVDAAADTEDKAVKKEEEEYEAALAELNRTEAVRTEAAEAVEDCYYNTSTYATFATAQYKLSNATRSWKYATKKVADMKPKNGIARLAGWKRKCVRFGFCLAIICSLGTSACASVAFYYSLQLQLLPQLGCVNGALQVTPFVALGFVALLIHGFMLWIATTQD